MMFLQSLDILKYPRTSHVEGSRLQEGDSSADQMALSKLRGKYAIIEEKIDGANTGISFSPDADLLLQSRGHYLLEEHTEQRQFRPFMMWANNHMEALYELLGSRYIMYGEWSYAKHSIFYDLLPHYFHEFDIYDKKEKHFLSTARRHEMLKNFPFLSVPVVYEGEMPDKVKLLKKLVVHSLAKTGSWSNSLEQAIKQARLNSELTLKQTDASNKSEGLYIKIEDSEHVLGRHKFVRADFTQTILDSGSHHKDRPVLPNVLHPLVDLYADRLAVTWNDLGLKTIHGLDALKALPEFSNWVDLEGLSL